MIKPLVIFVGGCGGSGKRMLKTFLAEKHESLELKGEMDDFIRSMNDVYYSPDGVYVYHTHDRYPPERVTGNTKVIIPVAHPLDVLLFTVFRLSPRKQIPQLKTDIWRGISTKNILIDVKKDLWKHEDIFGFEDHFDRWYCNHTYPVMFIKYKKMWEHIKEILEFCELSTDFEADFPEKHARVVDWCLDSEKELLLKTYKSLIEKYENMDDVTIFEGS